MYRYLDRPLVDLRDSERMLVWSMRRWLAAQRAGECPLQPVGAVFSARRLLSGLAPFQQMMLLLDSHARQVMVFGALRCRRVAEGEALLLALVGNVVRDPPGQTAATLSLMVPEPQIAALLDALSRLALALSAAGMTAPPALPRPLPRCLGGGERGEARDP